MAGPDFQHGSAKVDYARLRRAFETLSDIYQCGGRVAPNRDRLTLAGIPRPLWGDLSKRANRDAVLISELIAGPGQRSSVAGRREITIAVIAGCDADGSRQLQIGALETIGRGAVTRSLSVSTGDPAWRRKLAELTDWDRIDAVIACAEGNNQRAAIGLVLLLAGIGRGRLEILEIEVPDEIDESTHMVRVADWMKGGLPRFRSASAEALWALMRVRSVHSRLIKARKQGLYTSMAVAGLRAAGIAPGEIATRTGLSAALIDRFLDGVFRSTREVSVEELVAELGAGFRHLGTFDDPTVERMAMRVWRGAFIYARALGWRIEAASRARVSLAGGEGLVDVARSLNMALRDLVRILSVSAVEAREERDRFVSTIADPGLLAEIG